MRRCYLTPRLARVSLASFSDSACLPSAWSFAAFSESTLAWEAAASKRLLTVSLICFTSFGHWNANAGLASASVTTAENAMSFFMQSPLLLRSMPQVWRIIAALPGSAGHSLQLDENRTGLFDDGIAAELDRGVVDVGARRDVPAPRVPWTGHDRAFEVALAERTASVRTHVVDRVVAALDVEEGDRSALRLDDAPFPRGDLARRGHSHTRASVRHSLALRFPSTWPPRPFRPHRPASE